MFATVMAGLAAALLSVILAGGEEPILLPLFIRWRCGRIWGTDLGHCYGPLPQLWENAGFKGMGDRYCPHCGEKVE